MIDRKNSPAAKLLLQPKDSSALAAALENSLIFVALLIAVSAALYILNSQLLRIL